MLGVLWPPIWTAATACAQALLSGLGWSPLNLATLGLLALALLLVVSGPRQATTA